MGTQDARQVDPSQLRLRIPEDVRTLLGRIRDWEAQNPEPGSPFTLSKEDGPAGRRLVHLGLAFYSMDYEHIRLLRHLPVD